MRFIGDLLLDFPALLILLTVKRSRLPATLPQANEDGFWNYRNDLNPALNSSVNNLGCSHAA
jgi:hypothetical protein